MICLSLQITSNLKSYISYKIYIFATYPNLNFLSFSPKVIWMSDTSIFPNNAIEDNLFVICLDKIKNHWFKTIFDVYRLFFRISIFFMSLKLLYCYYFTFNLFILVRTLTLVDILIIQKIIIFHYPDCF